MDINKKLEEIGRELDGMTPEELETALSGTRVHLRHLLVLMRAVEIDGGFTARMNGCEKEKQNNCPRHFAERSLEQSLMVAIVAIKRYQDQLAREDH